VVRKKKLLQLKRRQLLKPLRQLQRLLHQLLLSQVAMSQQLKSVYQASLLIQQLWLLNLLRQLQKLHQLLLSNFWRTMPHSEMR
jgi:hypothetical protein